MTEQALIIRLADPNSDLAALGTLFQEMASHYFPDRSCSQSDAAMQVVERLKAHPGCEVLIAWRDGAPLGFAAFSVLFPANGLGAQIFLRDLFVTDRARSQGIGERLLRASASIAVERGCSRMDWTTATSNPDAMALYDRLVSQRLDEKVYYRLEGDALADFARGHNLADTQPAIAPRTVETERTLMRPHRLEDFEDLAAMWAEPAVVRHISGKPSTHRESWARLLRYIGHWSALGYGFWAVTDKQTGAFLGEVGFADFKRDLGASLDGMAEIGWVLTPSVHGRGLATETARAAVAWGDAHLTQDHTFCIIDSDHTASIRVAEKAGFRPQSRISYEGQPTSVLVRQHPR
ncbi:MAG: GNAT family N-acetyltransferase [Pseudomonadota bacterium]